MTVSKITDTTTNLGVVDKINEVIDNLGGGGGGSYTAGTGIDITNNVISVTSPTLTNNSALGLAILGSGASGQRSTAIGYNATASNMGSIAINDSNGQAAASGMYSISFGANSSATNTCSISIGYQANATGAYSIQLGYGTNSEASSFYVGTSSSNNWKMLGSDGLIPAARLTTMTGADGTNAGSLGAVPAPTATDNTKFLRGDGTWATAGGDGADIDLSNISNTGKIAIAHNSMPSGTYDDLTLGASGTEYTAPSDGYYFVNKTSNTSGQFLVIENQTTKMSSELIAVGAYNGLCAWQPVRKGEKVKINYNLGGATSFFRFVYAVGSESEA